MSVVLSYASKNIAIIACDGRIIDAKNNIIKEDYKKYVKVNDHVILGYAGELAPCECVSNLLTNPKNIAYIQTLSYEDIYNFVIKYCSTFPPNTRYGFILLGIGKGHRIAVAYIIPNKSCPITYITGDTINYQGLYPAELNDEDVFKKYLHTQNPIEAISSTIKYCADRSPSVNDRVYCDYIRLDPA